MVPVPHLPRQLRHRRRTAALALAVALLILAVECLGFNLPFWGSFGASTDSVSAENTLGPGLERVEGGLLRVTDPTQAWLQTETDGTSEYARVDVIAPQLATVSVVHVSAEVDGKASPQETISPASPRSLIIHASGAGMMRVWIREAKGAVVPIDEVRPNVRVPFVFDWLRVGVMAALALAVAVWRPGSPLWRIRLDTSSRTQRWGFVALLAPIAVVTAANIAWQLSYAWPLVFHAPGGYTYDFEQYGYTAEALMHGRTWLDLTVPDALASASDPYDVDTRNRLLAEGVTPIYWDHAFYQGRWYSYFGVLPAVLLFLPYRLLTGRTLPNAAAMHLLLFLALLGLWLLTIRLIARLAPRTSLAATLMALVFVPVAANFGYLCYRVNFYSVPFAASVALTSFGLWLWLGARTSSRPLTPSDRWSVDGAPELSLPRLGLGALCIAANFGCRPTFCLAALLGFPLFWPQIRALASALAAGRASLPNALRAPGVVAVSALVPVAPLMAYNHARFGSVFDFGNAYQLTVTDMTRFHEPVQDIPLAVGYYLFLPLRLGGFPFVRISPTPFPEWSFAEPMVGGLFVLCPLLALASVLPFLRRGWPSGSAPVRHMLLAMLPLGAGLTVFDAASAGLGWRYMCDFGWLFAFAALPVMLRVLGDADPRPTAAAPFLRERRPLRARAVARDAVRLLVFAVLLCSVAVAALSCFTPGRQDEMVSGNPRLYLDVMSWFSL
ncbi:hypothetical protein [Bifidobacterium saguinibicoloris]|uniref:hypothetical protein n=1 Tax=Bifidobacterium saguinibicoloris TaxID=2834433 RepID=UPI001C58630E|nr:hypothetical protein [Bifidobacterium saguinibicoloris]MBW3080771.1 hypothetical protein [Bifidobacterium saguinibicoloris]